MLLGSDGMTVISRVLGRLCHHLQGLNSFEFFRSFFTSLGVIGERSKGWLGATFGSTS